MIKHTFKKLLLYTVAVTLFVQAAAPPVLAKDGYDSKFYSANDILYYDPRDQCIHGGDSSTPSASIPTSTDLNENLKNIFLYFKNKGLSNVQAAAIIGNISQESGGNPQLLQGTKTRKQQNLKDPSTLGTEVGKGDGWGLIQWDAGGRAVEYAKKAGISGAIYEMGTQLDLIYWHMSVESPTSHKNMLQDWKGDDATDIKKATFYFEDTMEGAGRPMMANRYAAAEAALKKFGTLEGNPDLGPAENTCTCTPSLPKKGDNTIVLDPGHTRAGKGERDKETGLWIGEYANVPEVDDVWKVAQKVKTKLSEDGYTVILTKSAVDSYTNLKLRAEVANKANAALAVSIHTTPGKFSDSSTARSNPNWATPQRMNGWREGTKGRVTFTNQELADKSAGYAKKIAEARAKAIGGKAVVTTTLFDEGTFDRGGNMSKGNIAINQLFAKVPWVYNEAGQTGLNLDQYADGLIEGIKAAVPLIPTSSPTDATQDNPQPGGCADDGIADTSSLANTIRSYTWPDYKGRGYTKAKPAYVEATKVAARANLWVGNNGIDCGGYVTRLMQNSGWDKDYNNLKGMKGPTEVQWKYLKESGKYEKLNPKDTGELKLGDIAVTRGHGHTYMWVGDLEGINSKTVSASNGSRAPMADGPFYAHIGITTNGLGYDWFRLKKAGT